MGLQVAGIFAGVGGIEAGFHRAGHSTAFFCELDPHAQVVLRARFGSDVPLEPDVTALHGLPKGIDVVTAGFPCQDLSQAGRTAGIAGTRSRLVHALLSLLEVRKPPTWVVLENVSFMLRLRRGEAIRRIVDRLEEAGFRWAYRIVDSRAFGVPQRRRRVIIVASRTEDPRTVAFADERGEQHEPQFTGNEWCGFYWTEGTRGLGWTVDGVPTLKGGSTLGIPSPPAIWNSRNGTFGTPTVRDAERLQGFDPEWTAVDDRDIDARRHERARWRLVGNAITVPVAEWIGRRLAEPGDIVTEEGGPFPTRGPVPDAGYGGPKEARRTIVASSWPFPRSRKSLRRFLSAGVDPLSTRAARGFLDRLCASTLRHEPEFRSDLERYVTSLASRHVRPRAVA